MTHFKRKKCAVCGRTPTMRISRPAKKSHDKWWSCGSSVDCGIACPKCWDGRNWAAPSKERAKAVAASLWNALQRNIAKFGGGETE